MIWTILYLVAVQLLLPAVFIYSLWKKVFHSKLEWLTELLSTIMIIVWIFQAGRWDWTGYYLRFIWLVLLIAAFYRSWKKTRELPFLITLNGAQKVSTGIHVVLLLVFGMYNVFVISSYTTQDKAIELSFPLKSGTYYVGQGGNHVQMNYHNAYLPQKYALDIVKLNKMGMRANGLYPKDLEKYAIYGDELHSPCHGEVVEVRDHLPDLTPPEADPENPEGNYVGITCENEVAIIYIAHMKEGSVAVDKGSTVREGQKIGNVGNSGNTTEPHLHIHAEKDGKGIPIRFDGRFLVRNNLIR